MMVTWAAIQQPLPITTGLELLITLSGLSLLQRGCPSPSMIVTFQPMLQLSPKVILSPQDMSKQEFGMNPFPISTHPFTFKTQPHGMSNISFISTLITSSSKRTFRTPQRNHIKMDTYITPYFSSFYSAKEYIRTANGWNLNSLFQWERLEVEQQGVINGLYYFYEHKILRQIKIYFPINIIMYFSSWISHINTIVIHVTCYDRRHTNNRV